MWKSKFLRVHDAAVLDLDAIDATPRRRWRGDAGSPPLDGASAAAPSPRNDLVKISGPTHWLISCTVRDQHKPPPQTGPTS